MTTFQKYFRVFVLGMVYAASMALPYIHFKFYDIVREVTQTTNAELGYLMTVFIGVTMLFCMPGGVIANKFSIKKLIIVSLALSFFANLIFAFFPAYGVALCLWGFAAAAICIAWPGVVRLVRETGTKEEQGKMFGFFYGFQGLVMVVIGLAGAYIFGLFKDSAMGFRYLVLFQAGILLITAITVLLVIKDGKISEGNEGRKQEVPVFSNLLQVLKSVKVWVLVAMIFCGYGCYVGMGFLTPYTTNVLGSSVSLGAILGTIRVYGIKIFAGPVSGIIADKIGSAAKLVLVCFIFLIVFFWILINASGGTFSNSFILFVTMFMSVFSLMIFSIMFASLEELKIPAHQTSIVVGLITMLGYLPNAIFSPLFGYWLDKYGNTEGYVVIFEFLLILCIIGSLLAFLIYRIGRKE